MVCVFFTWSLVSRAASWVATQPEQPRTEVMHPGRVLRVPGLTCGYLGSDTDKEPVEYGERGGPELKLSAWRQYSQTRGS